MESYIVCEDRSNQPRIHVKICQCRCKNADSCQSFQDYMSARPAEVAVKEADIVPLIQEVSVPPSAP